MVQIYLIRHGIAVDRTLPMPDEDRPLTEQGRSKTKEVAQRLGQIGVKFDLILTSPLVRAVQTAQILQKTGLSTTIEEFTPLAPDGDIQTWVDWWTQSRYNKDRSLLALVGHQPNLGDWAEALVWGNSQSKLSVKKAGIIGVNIPETSTPIGKGQLFLLTSPKWLL